MSMLPFLSPFSQVLNRDSGRLALLYAALFWVVGVQMPFWPVWLKSQGMGSVEIGILLGAIYWAKVVTNPLIAQIVDRYGHRKTIMIVMVLFAASLYALYPWAEGFGQLLILGILGGSLLAGLMPLSETVTMTLTAQGKMDYGRIRLWGSISFIIFATCTGWLLAPLGSDVILWLILAGVGLSIICVLRVPNPPLRERHAQPLPFVHLAKDRLFILFLSTAALTQASHCVYYGFGTLNWQRENLGGGVIGGLWAVGVIAEVALFAFSGKVVAVIGPRKLLLIGAMAGLIRWTGLGLTVNLPALLVLQVLHAATFGATHLGAMHLIARHVDSGLQARAQALYSSVAMGLIPGIALLGTGTLFELIGGASYFVAAGISVIATSCGLALYWHPVRPPSSADST